MNLALDEEESITSSGQNKNLYAPSFPVKWRLGKKKIILYPENLNLSLYKPSAILFFFPCISPKLLTYYFYHI